MPQLTRLKNMFLILLQASLTFLSIDMCLSQVTLSCLYSTASSFDKFQNLFARKNAFFSSLKTTIWHLIMPHPNRHLFAYLRQLYSIIWWACFENEPTKNHLRLSGSRSRCRRRNILDRLFSNSQIS